MLPMELEPLNTKLVVVVPVLGVGPIMMASGGMGVGPGPGPGPGGGGVVVTQPVLLSGDQEFVLWH